MSRRAEVKGLSPRMLQVLELKALGKTLPQVALAMGLSPSTVRSYMTRAYFALGVNCLLDALVKIKELYPDFMTPAVLVDSARHKQEIQHQLAVAEGSRMVVGDVQVTGSLITLKLVIHLETAPEPGSAAPE